MKNISNKVLNGIKLIRVKHYIKNFLIFLPLIFSRQLLDTEKLFLCVLVFFSFSFLASIIYAINDIKDVEKDRKHPQKKYRPLAANHLSKTDAYIIIVILLILEISLNFIILKRNGNHYSFILFELLYFILNIGYSFGLKKVPILDVIILVSGFVIRVIYGGVISGIEISNWLYLTVMSGSFYMGFGKRRNELIKQKDTSRSVLNKYNKSFLDKFMYVFLVLSIVFYSLWCIDTNTVKSFGSNMVLSIPLILVILMKYSLDVEGDSFGDPVDIVCNDKVLLVLVLMLAIVMLGVMYI